MPSNDIEARKEYMRRYYLANKDKYEGYREKHRDSRNLRNRNAYANNEELRKKIYEQVKEYRRKNPGKKRNCDLKRNYGITSQEFDSILESQGGGCAICGRSQNKEKRILTLHVDHDHNTGKVRGILCSNCNMGVGKFQDDHKLLEKAAAYIRSYQDAAQ